jgi:hypothetical protein
LSHGAACARAALYAQSQALLRARRRFLRLREMLYIVRDRTMESDEWRFNEQFLSHYYATPHIFYVSLSRTHTHMRYQVGDALTARKTTAHAFFSDRDLERVVNKRIAP